MDPRRVNGGVFLGLDGIAIKSHGGTDAFGFASAINVGYEMAAGDLKGRIASDLGAFQGKFARCPKIEPKIQRIHARNSKWPSTDRLSGVWVPICPSAS